MKTWSFNEAQTHLSELIKFSNKEPQIISEKGQPVAVLVDIDLFNKFMAFQKRPTIAELLEELQQIHTESSVELDIPERTDRSNPLLDS